MMKICDHDLSKSSLAIQNQEVIWTQWCCQVQISHAQI